MEKPVIAVINDHEAFLEMMKTMLAEEMECEVVFGHQQHDALDVIRLNLPDLIILDVLVGYEPLGVEVLEAVRADPSLRKTPVIVCSAHVPLLQENAHKFEELDSVIVEKPFDMADMMKLVRKKLDSQ